MPQSQPRPKYVINPGLVQSRNDGQVHYVGAAALAMLYGLRRDDYIVISADGFHSHLDYCNRLDKAEAEGLIVLSPRFDGNYALPLSKE